jgi:hypothetical protein
MNYKSIKKPFDRQNCVYLMMSKSNILGATLAFFSSVLLFRLVHYMAFRYDVTVQTSLGITTGHPLWKQIQSRVLGPYIVKALTFGSLEYRHAHILFQIISVAMAAFLCWRLGRKYGGSDQSALLALTLFVTCFAFLLSPPWLMSWDFIDIIVFLVFIDLVLSRKGLQWFIGLFAIAIWNRDSTVFIALWLILDPLVQFFYQRHYKLPSAALDWRRMLAGVICIVLGLVSLELLKRNLLVEEIGPQQYPDLTVNWSGNSYNIVLGLNLELLKFSLTHLTRDFWFTVPVFLAMVATLGASLVCLDPERYLALYLVELSFILSLFVVGLFLETRLYLPLIPFVVAAAILLSNPKRS